MWELQYRWNHEKIASNSDNPSNWFINNQMKGNKDKYHLDVDSEKHAIVETNVIQ